MSQHEVELFALLVDETYGELTSRMFTILLRRGRLTIKLLQEHTQLSRSQLRHGLAVLIQQNLIYYLHEIETDETFYEANQDAAYGLVRSGKLMEIAEGRYGSVGLGIVRNLLLLGQSMVSNLIDVCGEAKVQEQTLKQNGKSNGVTNGINGDSHVTKFNSQLESTLAQLVEDGLVEIVKPSMFRSPTDTRNEIEKRLLKERYDGSTKGTKQKEELKVYIRDELQTLRSEEEDWSPRGKKRALNGGSNGMNGSGGSSKRRRLSQGSSAVNGDHGQGHDDIRLERDILLRINYEKFIVTLRNDRLVELVYNRIGETTSHIYAEILRLIEGSLPRCRLDPHIDSVADVPDGPTITTMELNAALSDSIDVSTGIGKASESKINLSLLKKETSGRKLKAEKGGEAEVDGYASPDEEESEQEDHDMNGNGDIPEVVADDDPFADEPFTDKSVAKGQKRAKVTFEDRLARPLSPEARDNRILQLKKHLMLLSSDKCQFLRLCGNQGMGEWTIDFEGLVNHLKESEVNFFLLENFGPDGHRLVQMMQKLGKVDEKILPHVALMTQKDIRTKLAEMQMAGVIEVQCIPRDAAHTVNRSIFLWFFDTDRVSTMFLDRIYKAMTRCIQRLEIERRRASGILHLTARSDVRDGVNEALASSQLNLLQTFEGKEEMLLGQVARLDELVGIFRDY